MIFISSEILCPTYNASMYFSDKYTGYVWKESPTLIAYTTMFGRKGGQTDGI